MHLFVYTCARMCTRWRYLCVDACVSEFNHVDFNLYEVYVCRFVGVLNTYMCQYITACIFGQIECYLCVGIHTHLHRVWTGLHASM